MTTDELRQLYIDFFEEKGHAVLPSASLIPANDPTLLLTSAGMVPFKSYFLGLDEPPQPRVTTCQRCIRTGDIENVGKTDRHHTFFEMLGNFSFGDYFKREAIEFAWEFVTERLKLEKEKLWATIYLDDDESHDLWNHHIGLPAERIVRLGREDNFWEIGVGPCGPCSEIHYDRGPKYGCGKAECAPGCEDCDRYLEFWNLVFIQFHQDEKGHLTPLEDKGVDTGMGLERTAAMLQGTDSNFEIDLILPIVREVARIAGINYGEDVHADASVRVVADHARAITFMICDGMSPGNEGRSYVLRRLLRRAVRHAHLIGIDDPFLPGLSSLVIDLMKDAYPELIHAEERIKEVIFEEERRFRETLVQGTDMLERLMDKITASRETVLSGEDAFRLYDTYGFPLELTEEMLEARDLSIDKDGFDQAMAAQRERARLARNEHGYLGNQTPTYHHVHPDPEADQFVGYDTLSIDTRVAALGKDGELIDQADSGEVDVFLDVTPFYAEAGGQVSDRGTLTSGDAQFVVDNVMKTASGHTVHRGRVLSGTLKVGDPLRAEVSQSDRVATARNHTATHLLHQALRDVLGDHVEQAGSLVAPDRLRFDFTHFKSLCADELEQIEQLVNDKILSNLDVTTVLTDYRNAIASGAMALFGEKYGDTVRVVKIGTYSQELCGGTHVRQSAELGLFKLIGESSVAAGVRRIEAVTGMGTLQVLSQYERILSETAQMVQAPPTELHEYMGKLLAHMKEADRELAGLKRRLAKTEAERLMDGAVQMGTVHVVVDEVEGLDMNAMRSLGDDILARFDRAVVVLGSAVNGRVQLIGMVNPQLNETGLKADEIIKMIAPTVNGGGGGHARMAQAGGKDGSKLADALKQARDEISKRIQ